MANHDRPRLSAWHMIMMMNIQKYAEKVKYSFDDADDNQIKVVFFLNLNKTKEFDSGLLVRTGQQCTQNVCVNRLKIASPNMVIVVCEATGRCWKTGKYGSYLHQVLMDCWVTLLLIFIRLENNLDRFIVAYWVIKLEKSIGSIWEKNDKVISTWQQVLYPFISTQYH